MLAKYRAHSILVRCANIINNDELHDVFKMMLDNVRKLGFEEEPDYQYIIRIFSDLLLEQKRLNGEIKQKEDINNEDYDEENDDIIEEKETYEWS